MTDTKKKRKKTVFKVDDELCIGCGLCIDACPMKILDLVDNLCILTDDTKCLECGTCMRECPQDAIFIEGVTIEDKQEESQQHSGSAREADVSASSDAADVSSGGTQFTPILKKLSDCMEAVKPVQIFEHMGTDITSLDEFDLEGEKCYYRAYKDEAGKLEKIGISRMNFYGSMVADVLVITPGPEYDIPYYVMDWDESEGHIFFICDLMPSDDLGRNLEQLNKYFYEPLEDMYQEYATIPGLKESVFHWVRAVHSPYIVTGTIDKSNRKNVARLFNCAVDYFNVWLKLYRDAEPQDTSSQYMKLIHERRKNIRALYKENDPGVGSLNKFLGDKMAEASLSIIEP